jgi:exodeoxyribonuclease-1
MQPMAQSIYWYDYETFGVDPRRCRAAQFAGLRTDESLAVMGEPLVMYCQPAPDFLPSAESCLITGITPQLALQQGVTEAEFITRIHAEFAQPQTCVAGYNNIRFDDELTRQLLYRNFHDPYEREYKSGNSRWDIIDMLRLCAAVRPEGIQWPRNGDGQISFRLEELTAANGIPHGDAHDALADVHATIAMARLVRDHQRRLYDYVYELRAKARVEAQLDLRTMKPVLHVSSRYPASLGCLALVSPLCRHPVDGNGVVVVDLREDPADWIDLPAEEIQRRVFTASAALPEGESRIPLKVLHVNRCPVVAPAATLEPALAQRYQIDLAACETHWQRLRQASGLAAKLARVFAPGTLPPEQDPDFMIYSGGFFSEGDRRLMQVIRDSTPQQLANLNLPFKDRRLHEMLFRYRARNFPASLDAGQRARWLQFCHQRVTSPEALEEYRQSLESARERCSDAKGAQVLQALEDYVAGLSGP